MREACVPFRTQKPQPHGNAPIASCLRRASCRAGGEATYRSVSQRFSTASLRSTASSRGGSETFVCGWTYLFAMGVPPRRPGITYVGR